MKRVVWENKSNKQLCVTIPKEAGVKAGDIINVEKEKINKIVYTFVVADLFHYGHLQLLEKANKLGDLHICGILTDKAVSEYKPKPIASFEERRAIISSLRCVDMVMTQNSKDPTENLKKIHEQFKDSTIILVHASNWKKIPGEEYIKKINGKVIRPSYYSKLSDNKIIQEIKERKK